MKKTLLLSLIIIFNNLVVGQSTISLFEDSIGIKSISKKIWSNPIVNIYSPKQSAHAAVIIFPGGAYSFLAKSTEGDPIAKAFAQRGIVSFIVNYRLQEIGERPDRSITPLIDAQQAIYLIRKNANKLNINIDKIGVIGFSAGGHLASMLGTHFDTCFIPNPENISLRPNFMILMYPVITMDSLDTHWGSRINLLGQNPSREQIEFFSSDKQVTSNTPPSYITHTTDDKVVNVNNSLLMYQALVENNVSAELHLYPRGNHGFIQRLPTEDWLNPILSFMRKEGMLSSPPIPTPWPVQKSNKWYAKQRFLVGANFTPSTAINQLEMWQLETFDPITIDRELKLASGIGMNCMRVYLHHAAWAQDKRGFKKRMNTYLSIADKYRIKTMFVFFDDCWRDDYQIGKQPAPKLGIHNSGWIKDPGNRIDTISAMMDTLKNYVTDILQIFKHDKRVLLWDLYNEAGHFGHGNKSLELLKNVFIWARAVNPDQPLSSGLWNDDLKEINNFILDNSDVITYHSYLDSASHQRRIDSLRKWNKPMICTEYMARKRGSTFQTILPLLKRQNIGAINWGLVAGKTNTIYAWDEPMPDGGEPKLWFHDIFRKDGTPYSKEEVDLIRSVMQPDKEKSKIPTRK